MDSNDDSSVTSQSRPNKPRNDKKKAPHSGRIIIRNISFKATEDALREHFQQFGEIEEVKLLKKPDGKLVGCGFVQFTKRQNAAKAIHHTTFKPFLGRPIVADWAVAKDRYVNVKVKEEKDEKINVEDVQIKEEPAEDVVVKEEKDEKEDVQEEEKDVEDDVVDEKDSNDDSDENEESDDEPEIKDEEPENEPVKKRFESHDVDEGKTVFVKNIPFTATNEDLKECMRQFGRVYYALICKDKLTEFSKGTGFVKFVNKEDAEKCLQAGTELQIADSVLDCHLAVDRKVLNKKQEQKANSNMKSDSRNLYLAKEGVILAGTPAAEGVSASDMSKRLQLEQWKSQMLRNLHMFVSKNRLVVHNVPFSWDDKKLRNIFLKSTSENARITESKIMRNMSQVNAKGVGQSKGYGFVTFTDHNHALQALRTLNNNPQIFTEKRRPIVAFSVENRVMINAKQRRMEKSRQNNPLCKDYIPRDKSDVGEKKIVKLGRNKLNKKQKEKDLKKEKQKNKMENETNRKRKLDEDNDEKNKNNKKMKKSETNDQPVNKSKKSKKNKSEKQSSSNSKQTPKNFVGFTSREGQIQNLRSKSKLKTQAALHMKNLKKTKNQKRMAIERERLRQPKQKRKRGGDDDRNFTQLVNKYKATLAQASVVKNKWFDV